MNTISHPTQFRYWPKYRAWGTNEREAYEKRRQRQRRWASNTISGYEATEIYYSQHPEHRNGWPSVAKQKQYEAALAFSVTEKLSK